MKKRNEVKSKAGTPAAGASMAATAIRSAGTGRRAGGLAGGIDLETVRELARIAAELDLSEVEADPSGHIRVRRRVGRRAPELKPAARAPISLAPPPPVEGAAEPGTFITSPFVGTFYRAPSPDTPPFVEVGETVRKGQVVCIVEAMKLMNEIETESEGKVVEILAKNGEHVEYGQPLLRMTKS
jgi:acetyl-CoA carboxylase biotin carboxyl carrier protein